MGIIVLSIEFIKQMTNYKILTGPFEGSVVEENTQILDVNFPNLDEDLQIRIREFAEDFYKLSDSNQDFPEPLNLIKERYENSWDTEETRDPVDLKPVSEWA